MKKEAIYVSEKTYNWLIEELAKPPKINNKLKKLLNTPAPWEFKGNTKNVR